MSDFLTEVTEFIKDERNRLAGIFLKVWNEKPEYVSVLSKKAWKYITPSLGLPILEELKLGDKYEVRRVAIEIWEVTEEVRRRLGERGVLAKNGLVAYYRYVSENNVYKVTSLNIARKKRKAKTSKK